MFSSERVSVFIRYMRLCNDGEISSSVVLIITIFETVAGAGVSIIVIIKTTDDEISPSSTVSITVIIKTTDDEISPSSTVSIIVIIKTTDDEISPSLHNRIDLINTDTLSDENLMMARLGRNM